MCMGGGGGGGSVITMPDTGAYDRQLNQQLQMMQMAQSSEMTGYQSKLDSAVMSQQKLLGELRDLREEKAEDVASVEAEARRMSNIIGTPPPEESAKAPVIADARKRSKAQASKGKSGLRIARTTAKTSGDAVGYNLNI